MPKKMIREEVDTDLRGKLGVSRGNGQNEEAEGGGIQEVVRGLNRHQSIATGDRREGTGFRLHLGGLSSEYPLAEGE